MPIMAADKAPNAWLRAVRCGTAVIRTMPSGMPTAAPMISATAIHLYWTRAGLKSVAMTAVPQRTALSHAFGALSATMIGIAEYYVHAPHVTKFSMVEIAMEVIIGSLTFTGSLIAAGNIQEI